MYVPLFLCVRVHVYVWVWVLKLAVKFSFVLCCCRTANRPIPAPITLPTFCLHSFAKSISKMCKTFSCNVDDVVVVVVGGSRIKSDSPQDILYLIYSVTAIYSSLARSLLPLCMYGYLWFYSTFNRVHSRIWTGKDWCMISHFTYKFQSVEFNRCLYLQLFQFQLLNAAFSRMAKN